MANAPFSRGGALGIGASEGTPASRLRFSPKGKEESPASGWQSRTGWAIVAGMSRRDSGGSGDTTHLDFREVGYDEETGHEIGSTSFRAKVCKEVEIPVVTV